MLAVMCRRSEISQSGLVVWMLPWTFISKHSEALDAHSPFCCLSLMEEKWRRRRDDTNPVLVIFVTLAVNHAVHRMNVECLFLNVLKGFLWFLLGVWLLVLKAWSRGWLYNVLGGCVSWGTWMLSSLACWWPLTPQHIVGGGSREGGELQLKV